MSDTSKFYAESLEILEDEPDRLTITNEVMIYFQALAETRINGRASSLFQCLPKGVSQGIDDTKAREIHDSLIEFIDRCEHHPSVSSCFKILWYLEQEDLTEYLISKLRRFIALGDAQTVFQLCLVIDNGYDKKVFIDGRGQVVESRSFQDVELNMEFARRFLDREDAKD